MLRELLYNLHFMTEILRSTSIKQGNKDTSSVIVYDIKSLNLSAYDDEISGLKNGTMLMADSSQKPVNPVSDNPLTKRVPWGMEESNTSVSAANLP